ncbi:MAG: methicillin resistance protein, partial [Nitrospiraceae bacterium]
MQEEGRFQILDARVPEDRDEWLARWSAWPNRECTAHPAYSELFARSCDKALCAALGGAGGGILFPFILRPLAAERWAGETSSFYDISTPYGYGGPFAWGHTDGDYFWREFDNWAESMNVVSLFARLSLFPEQMIPFKGGIEVRGRNIVRTLTLDSCALWMDYRHCVRKHIKVAQRAGLEVEPDFTGEKLEGFLAIYYSTMTRRNAEDSYFFPKEFFQRILTHLSGQFVFFHTLHKGKSVSTELVLLSRGHIYSFLGGTLSEAFEFRPNNLLKHAIIEWGREQGLKSYVLGGGYRDQDGIYRYKLSFAPTGEVPFRFGKKVYDQKAYEELVRMRRKAEADCGK